MIKTKLVPKLKFLTLALFLITPIPAALTRDPYSTIRSLPLVVPQTILIGFSICLILRYIWKDRLKVFVFVSILLFLFLFSFLELYSNVFVVDLHYKSKYWNYGWKEVVETLKAQPDNVEVVVDNSRAESYIEILFYSKFDPNLYQQNNVEVDVSEYYSDLDRVKEKKIGKIITRPINWEVDTKEDKYLVGDELSISSQQIKEHKFTLVREILFPDGSVAFRIIRTNPERL